MNKAQGHINFILEEGQQSSMHIGQAYSASPSFSHSSMWLGLVSEHIEEKRELSYLIVVLNK